MSENQIRLYYWPDTASFAPHVCLRHAGESFDLIQMNLKAGKFTTTFYKDLNPHFRIPTYTEGDPETGGLVLYEAAAICLHIADKNPNALLMPPVGGNARAHAYKYLIYLTNTVQAELMVFNYARRHCIDEAVIPSIKAAGDERLGKMFRFLDKEVSDGRDWLAGDRPGCADFYLLMVAGWAEYFKVSEPPSANPNLLSFLRHVQDVPAVKIAMEAEGFAPYF